MRRFSSRMAAAAELAGKLLHYRGKNPLILAIPRGALPMGRVLADALRRWPSGVALRFADLSSAAAGPSARLDDVARLLLALEHL